VKASEYKALYDELEIFGHNDTVSIHQYRLGQPKDGGTTRKALLDKVGPKGIQDFELRVGPKGNLQTVDPAFTKTSAFHLALASPFTGKGAPEHCQLVLQLADHFNLAPGGDLQRYADTHLGLDCNGFVGNYLWHEWKGNPWTNPGRGDKDYDGPDMRLDGFRDVRRHNRVKKWSEINTNLLYLFIRVTENGDIIVNAVGDPIGHIVITDSPHAPGAATDADKHIAVRVVESSGSHHPPGLYENWYSWLTEKNAGTKDAIFYVDRGGGFTDKRQIWFLIVRVDPVKK
jgi:hypothetical protein